MFYDTIFRAMINTQGIVTGQQIDSVESISTSFTIYLMTRFTSSALAGSIKRDRCGQEARIEAVYRAFGSICHFNYVWKCKEV
jgi:hypothetical protein